MIILNTLGILLNMLGLILIFKYGISPMTPKSGKIFLYNREELQVKKSKQHKKERIYRNIAVSGLWLSMLGMSLQLISLYF